VRELVAAPTGKKMTDSPDFLDHFYVRRGNYNYSEQKEFFSSDLIDDYSKAHFARAVELAQDPLALKESRIEWSHSIALHPDNPSPHYRRGFASFQNNDLAAAFKRILRPPIDPMKI